MEVLHMIKNVNITKNDFVFVINCIKALDAKIEAEAYPQAQGLMEQFGDVLLGLLETAVGDTESRDIGTWLLDPELILTEIEADGELRDWYPETAEELYDWLTGLYGDDLHDAMYEEAEAENVELF